MENGKENSSPETLDIVLPCFNPKQGWERIVIDSVKAIQSKLPEKSIGLILVNDGSTNGITTELIDTIRKRLEPISFQYVQYPTNQGKGFALRTGVAKSKAKLTVFTDIDFPYTLESFVSLVHELKFASVAAGVRSNTYYLKVPKVRMRISRFLRWLLKTFLKLKITDTQCGLKGFDEKGRDLFLKTRINRFLFDMEFLFLASNTAGLNVKPVPVSLREGVEFSTMNTRILLAEGWNFVRIFFRFLLSRSGA